MAFLPPKIITDSLILKNKSNLTDDEKEIIKQGDLVAEAWSRTTKNSDSSGFSGVIGFIAGWFCNAD